MQCKLLTVMTQFKCKYAKPHDAGSSHTAGHGISSKKRCQILYGNYISTARTAMNISYLYNIISYVIYAIPVNQARNVAILQFKQSSKLSQNSERGTGLACQSVHH